MHYMSLLLVLVELNGIQTFVCLCRRTCSSVVPCINLSLMVPFLSEGMRHRMYSFQPKCIHEFRSNCTVGTEGRLEPFLLSPRSLHGSEVETQMDAVSPKRATDISCICLHFISIPVCLLPPNFSDAAGDGEEGRSVLLIHLEVSHQQRCSLETCRPGVGDGWVRRAREVHVSNKSSASLPPLLSW